MKKMKKYRALWNDSARFFLAIYLWIAYNNYLVIKSNYFLLYRVGCDTVSVIRILNKKQDFLHIESRMRGNRK